MDRIIAEWHCVTIRERDTKYYAVYVYDKRVTYWVTAVHIAVSEFQRICDSIKYNPEIEIKCRELIEEMDAIAKAFLGRYE